MIYLSFSNLFWIVAVSFIIGAVSSGLIAYKFKKKKD